MASSRGVTGEGAADAAQHAAEVISPISMACFMEGIPLVSVPMTGEEGTRVAEGLATLQRKPAVEAYLFCLQQLLLAHGDGAC
jgi:hypothetical protein